MNGGRNSLVTYFICRKMSLSPLWNGCMCTKFRTQRSCPRSAIIGRQECMDMLCARNTHDERAACTRRKQHQGQSAHYVEELAQLVQLGARPDQALGEVARVAGGKADALDARHVMHMPQQVRERPGPATRACDITSKPLLRSQCVLHMMQGTTSWLPTASSTHASQVIQ
jgi:hypothetical protein